ncbi:pyridoxal-phosphate-dependent aminotransferase family protein [Sabulicella rubraurantiaca]|uniref:pyridoxal-phosphate-dependent aminotransferase family protein n=1 Tax=Sabulicella rubraurantiaca TaxID=2811429 RepID=UPI001A957D29|nr:alanine--glyoxylate aminotransferase family protein [Sabulicella rubraurantiaca]
MNEVVKPRTGSEGVPTAYRLRLPGPTAVPERVRAAMARPVLNHRGPEFRDQLAAAEQLLRPILGTENPVLFFGCSGTGMMEAALLNLLAPGERLLCIIHGQFGERFAAIGEALGAQVDRMEMEWGEGIDIGAVAARLDAARYRAVTVIHNESSTGAVADLAELGALLRDRPEILVVDSVSGLGAVPMRQDEWGVDVVVSASQKALMCPPGLGLVSLSAKARAVVARQTTMPRFYFDFRRALDSANKGETPFTPPTALVAALVEALGMIHAEGLDSVLTRHRALSSALRAGATAIGLPDFTRAPTRSSSVVVLSVPPGLEGGAIVRAMRDRYGSVIAGARNRLAGRVIRIGTMGFLAPSDILTDLQELEQVLVGLGHPLEIGAGVAAAARSLHATTPEMGSAPSQDGKPAASYG